MTEEQRELVRAFEALELEPSAFHHAEHVVVAYALLCKYSFLDASVTYAKNIDNMATNAGAPDKFNMTITLAFMSLIAERMAVMAHTSYAEFIAQNPDLLEKEALTKIYSPKRLHSASARETFLMPDRPSTASL